MSKFTQKIYNTKVGTKSAYGKTIACEICSEVNYAVKHWSSTPDGITHPLLGIILKSITDTEHIAVQAEDDKCFKKGTSVNRELIKNPPIHHTPKRARK